MSVDNTPTIDTFRPVVLQVLSSGEVLSSKEVSEKVADYMRLSPEVRAERLPSGGIRYSHRINWACSGLEKAGLLRRPRRGHYVITDNGRTVNSRHLSIYGEKDMLEWQAWREYQEELAERKRKDSPDTGTGSQAENIAAVSYDNSLSPLEAMASHEQALNFKVETELRERLQQASPEFFEKAVIELLWAMGYGGTQGKKKHVGRTNDGGIDGIISQDALGLTNVYIQAKRYADTNRVGEPEIRNFIGSLDAKGANLGVFITTSSFLPKAEKTAAAFRHGRIVLINGQDLTRYMLDYGVAVEKKQVFTLYEVDEDFFDEDYA